MNNGSRISFIISFSLGSKHSIIAIVIVFLSHKIECECMLRKMDCLEFHISTHAFAPFLFSKPERKNHRNIVQYLLAAAASENVRIRFDQHSEPLHFGHYLITPFPSLV